MPAERILARLKGEPWVIQPEWLAKMIDIAERSNIETLEAKPGVQLEHAYTTSQRGSSAVIPIEGPIFPKANLMTEISGATALSLVAEDFQAALENDAVENIVLKIDSPGGNATGIDEMASLIRSAEKPVHAHVSGVGASAAYWIASAADSISVSPSSSVGSIGVAYVSRRNNQDETIEFVSSLSPKKRLSPETEEGEAEIMTLIDGMAEVFIDDVAQGRHTSSEDVLANYGQGGMMIASKALEVGMIDRVGTFEELMADLSGQSTSSYGDYQMNIEQLKAEHEDTYKLAFQEGVTSADRTHEETINGLEAENADLKVENEDLRASNQDLEARVEELENKEAIRHEKLLKSQADGITQSTLASSDIPERLYARVKIDHSQYVGDEGELDTKEFTKAVKAEVDAWETDLKADTTSVVENLGDGGQEASAKESDEADEVVARMLSYVQ